MRNFPQLQALLIFAAFVGFAVSSVTVALEPENDNPVNPRAQPLIADTAMANFNANGGLIPAHDRDAESWLRRAKDASDRGDWKLAIDTLERVIRDHNTSIVAVDGGISFRSAVDLGMEQIGAFPPEGLEAYRVLCDPIAKRLLEKGKTTHDLSALREIADVYPWSSVGGEALNLLTAWLLDERRPVEALDYLARLDQQGVSDLDKREITLRRAVAFLLIGRSAAAEAALNALRDGSLGDEAFLSRIDALSTLLDRQVSGRMFDSQPDVDLWPNRMGPIGTGQATVESPTFNQKTTDYFDFPLPTRPDRSAIREIMRRRGRPPVWQAVTDGDRLFVTCPTGLFSLDPTNLELNWKAFPKSRPRDERIQTPRIMIQGWGIPNDRDDEEALDDLATQSLFREARGSLSLGLGYVFILSQDPFPGEQNPTKRGRPQDWQFLDSTDAYWSNTLNAYDKDTGVFSWIRGRGGPPNDPLSDARFYSCPIVSGDELFVTYVRSSGDLYLGALNRNGDLLREIVIGAGGRGTYPFYGILEPAMANGRIYVPSGAGLLTAIRRRDFAPVWLSRYEREQRTSNTHVRRGMLFGNQNSWFAFDEWLSSPPLVVNGRVILAAQDSDDLVVFNEQDGGIIWTRPRDEHRYLIGCDDKRVYVGGKSIEAISIEDGKRVWEYRASGEQQLAGRPILTKDGLLVSTFERVLRLDIETGEPAPLVDMELGNLLALPGSLYSIDAFGVTKLTDPREAERIVRKRLDQNPDDVGARMRLATLQFNQDRPTDALEQLKQTSSILDRQEQSLAPDDLVSRSMIDDDRVRLSAIFVTVLRSLATAAEEVEEQESLLRDAIAVARRPEDRVSAGLDLAAHHFADGNEVEACRICVDILSRRELGFIDVDPTWRARASIEVGRRFARYLEPLTDEQQEELLSSINAQAEDYLDRDDRYAVEELTDALVGTSLGIQLDRRLAAASIESGSIETARYFLNRAADQTSDAPQKDQILWQLALLTLDPPAGVLPSPNDARDIISHLSSSAIVKLAQDPTIRERLNLEPGAGEQDLISALRPSSPKVLQTVMPLSLFSEDYVAEDTPFNGDVVSFWDSTRGYDANTPVVPVQIYGQVRGLVANAAGSDRYEWVNDLEFESTGLQNDELSRSKGPRKMVISNGVAITHGRNRVDAVGLSTGRLLWKPIPTDFSLDAPPDPPVLAKDGTVIVALDKETIVAAPARDSARPIWKRTWPRRQIGIMRIGPNGRLIVVDFAKLEAMVLEPETGQLEREYAFGGEKEEEDLWESSDEKKSLDDFITFNRGILAFAKDRNLSARRGESGQVAWRHTCDGRILKITSVGTDHFCVFSSPNRVEVLRADTGDVETSFNADGLSVPPVDVVLDSPEGSGPRLLLFAATDDEVRPEFVLQSYPLTAKPVPWREELVLPSVTITPQMMRASPNYVAVITNDVRRDDRFDAGPGDRVIDTQIPPQLVVLSKANGQRMCLPYKFYEGAMGGALQDDVAEFGNPLIAKHRSRQITDVIILDERIIAVAPEGFYVLGIKEETGDE